MRSVVFAYQDIGYVCLRELLGCGDTICAVITHDDDPNEQIWFRSVRDLAAAHNLPVFAPSTVNSPEWIARIRAWEPDFIFSFYYRQLLAPEVLTVAARGALNLHGSLLPRYRGRCPVNWVLIHGEDETGVTLHYMEAKADRGDIVAQRRVAISDDDTALSLSAKLAEAAAVVIRESYPLLCREQAPRIPQDPAYASYFGGRRPSDGKIDWKCTARQVFNLVRAVTHPYPGAFAECDGQRIYIWETRLPEHVGANEFPPGTIVATEPSLIVQTGQGLLEVTRVQPQGEEESSATQWAARRSIGKGAILT